MPRVCGREGSVNGRMARKNVTEEILVLFARVCARETVFVKRR